MIGALVVNAALASILSVDTYITLDTVGVDLTVCQIETCLTEWLNEDLACQKTDIELSFTGKRVTVRLFGIDGPECAILTAIWPLKDLSFCNQYVVDRSQGPVADASLEH